MTFMVLKGPFKVIIKYCILKKSCTFNLIPLFLFISSRCTKSSKKKYLAENPNKKSEYTVLDNTVDNTVDEKFPIISKARVHTIHRIAKKRN